MFDGCKTGPKEENQTLGPDFRPSHKLTAIGMKTRWQNEHFFTLRISSLTALFWKNSYHQNYFLLRNAKQMLSTMRSMDAKRDRKNKNHWFGSDFRSPHKKLTFFKPRYSPNVRFAKNKTCSKENSQTVAGIYCKSMAQLFHASLSPRIYFFPASPIYSRQTEFARPKEKLKLFGSGFIPSNVDFSLWKTDCFCEDKFISQP